ncbi:MAG: hypothetical protein AAGE52_15105 [Myxococcota bacterium]
MLRVPVVLRVPAIVLLLAACDSSPSGSDAGSEDAAVSDAPERDGRLEDAAPALDASVDVSVDILDASADANADAATDSATDAPLDAPLDASVDGPGVAPCDVCVEGEGECDGRLFVGCLRIDGCATFGSARCAGDEWCGRNDEGSLGCHPREDIVCDPGAALGVGQCVGGSHFRWEDTGGPCLESVLQEACEGRGCDDEAGCDCAGAEVYGQEFRCEEEGATYCSWRDDTMLRCVDRDRDGCLELEVVACADGESCRSGGRGGCECESVCTAGQEQCRDGVPQVCDDRAVPGCFRWSSLDPCDSGRTCREDAITCSPGDACFERCPGSAPCVVHAALCVPNEMCIDECRRNLCGRIDGRASMISCGSFDDDGCRDSSTTLCPRDMPVCNGAACAECIGGIDCAPFATCSANVCVPPSGRCTFGVGPIDVESSAAGRVSIYLAVEHPLVETDEGFFFYDIIEAVRLSGPLGSPVLEMPPLDGYTSSTFRQFDATDWPALAELDGSPFGRWSLSVRFESGETATPTGTRDGPGGSLVETGRLFAWGVCVD